MFGHDSHLKWTSGGLNLLATINKVIAEHGGSEAFYNEILSENTEEPFYRSKTQMNVTFKKIIQYQITARDGADILNLSLHDYNRRLKKYKKMNNINN